MGPCLVPPDAEFSELVLSVVRRVGAGLTIDYTEVSPTTEVEEARSTRRRKGGYERAQGSRGAARNPKYQRVGPALQLQSGGLPM